MNPLLCHEVADKIRIEELAEGYPCVVITNANATAKIALHGAHVIDYTPAGQQPVIFTSKEAIYREGKAIRGGIPVCWPWFSAHPSDASQPAHGFARNAFWQLFRSSSDDELSTLVFTFSRESLHAELTIEIGKELKVSLKTTNTGDQTQEVGGALHSYFTVSNIADISITGLEDVSFHDSLTGDQGRENESIKIDEEIDRVYLSTTDKVSIQDLGWNRNITISKSGSKSTVVWNPWIEKSAGMGDLGNEEYKEFVCIETANALTDVYQVAPGETHILETCIQSTPR